MSQFHLR